MARRLARIIAAIIASWAVYCAIYLLFFATVTSHGVTSSSTPGQPEVTTTFTRQERFITMVEPFGIAFILAFSSALMAGAAAAWRGSLAATAMLAGVGLAATSVSGFSIGPLYLPGSAGLVVCTGLLGIDRLMDSRS